MSLTIMFVIAMCAFGYEIGRIIGALNRIAEACERRDNKPLDTHTNNVTHSWPL